MHEPIHKRPVTPWTVGKTYREADEERELWRPSRDEQMAAVEVLLASSIAYELRRELRAREIELSRSNAR
jgi:hypothetical protein